MNFSLWNTYHRLDEANCHRSTHFQYGFDLEIRTRGKVISSRNCVNDQITASHHTVSQVQFNLGNTRSASQLHLFFFLFVSSPGDLRDTKYERV